MGVLAATPETTDGTVPASVWEPKVVAFVCGWCTTLAADLAGTESTSYSSGVRLVRVPCAGRINPLYILRALRNGADAVLVCGCHPGDCHYSSGNLIARRRFALLQSYLEYVGVGRGRVRFAWVSGSEGSRFAALVREATEDARRLGPAVQLVATSPGGKWTSVQRVENVPRH